MAKKPINSERYLEIKNLLKEVRAESTDDLNNILQEMAKAILENSLEVEQEEHLGYEKWDQDSHLITENSRKGHTSKTVKSKYGEFDIAIPRDRNGTFEPKIVKKYQTDITALDDKIISLYAKGMSTRDISDTMQDLYGVETSKDFISKVTDKILPEINSSKNKPLQSIYPIIFVDGIRFKVKEESAYKEKSVYLIIGVDCDGMRDILGFWIGESESAKMWLNIFNDIKARGVQDILIFCSDNLKGISEAIIMTYPNVKIQKCIIHQIRNSTKYVRYDHLKEFTSDMKKIYSAPNLDLAMEALEQFSDKWNDLYGYAVKSWESNIDELTTFFEFPVELRKLIYTTNVIESFNRKIRKVTKTKSGFSSEKSLEKLLYLIIQDQLKKWDKRIVNWGLIYNQLKILFEDRI